MIAVIFEVEPAEGRRDAYLGIAADLRPLLDGIDGFISSSGSRASAIRAASCRCRSGATRKR